MFVGILQVELRISGATTLKDRRRVVRSLKDRLQSRFKVSVAEIGQADIHQEAALGIALVCSEAKLARSMCDRIARFLERVPDAEVVDLQTEIL